MLHYWVSSCDLHFIYSVPVFMVTRETYRSTAVLISISFFTRKSTLCPFWHSSDPISSTLSMFLWLHKKQIWAHLFWSENLHLLLLTCWLNTNLDNPVLFAEIFPRQAMVVGGQLSSTIYLQFSLLWLSCWQNNSCKVFGLGRVES
jgi:hypothetical protein